jgi:hypothetical protein
MLTAAGERIWSWSRAWGPRSAAPACCTTASIEPVESSTPNISPISSTVSRRETRLRTASVATAACSTARHLGWKLGPCLGGAGGTAQPVQAMLGDRDGDRRQLADLVALRPGCRSAFLLAKAARAGLAALRPALDQLVHTLESELAILREQVHHYDAVKTRKA